METVDQIEILLLSDTSREVMEKREEFIMAGRSDPLALFSELCFCILAANTSAEMGLRSQKLIGSRRLATLPEQDLRDLLKIFRYRFYNVRSKFIVSARSIIEELPSIISLEDKNKSRELLVEKVDGIGYKEASHFLRNVGIFDFAILDKHIVRMLTRRLSIVVPATLTDKKYLELEKHFIDIAKSYGLEPGILDLYMWKLATGRIIK